MVSRIRLLAIVLVSVTCLFFIPIQTAHATDTSSTKPKGLTLSPLRSELDIAPGTSLDGTLTVTNSTDKPMSVSMSAEEFKVIDRQYNYAFTAESDVTKWITFTPSEANLAAGQSVKIKYLVGVPISAEPGGRYISLFAGAGIGDTGSASGSEQRVGSLLYITVLGDVTRSGHLLSLASPWVISGNGSWSVTLQNTGTTHYRSNYSAKVENLFGGKVANMSGSALILPGSVRAVSDTLPSPSLPGVYKIVYTVGLGDKPSATETRYILYVPPWAILIIVAVVVVLTMALLRKRSTKN